MPSSRDVVRELVLPFPNPHAREEEVVMVDDVLSDEVVNLGPVPRILPSFSCLPQGLERRRDVAEVVVEPPVQYLPVGLLQGDRYSPSDVSGDVPVLQP